jgi:arginine utilization protein RocB
VTGTEDEASFARKLETALREAKFETWRQPLPDDAIGRSNVFALKRGNSRETVVLAGHFDTVPIEDYGALRDLALEPQRLAEATIKRLRQSGESALALADLESGDFLPGRGLLDMKSGLAAGIAAMELHDGDLSVLLVATPDEEEKSAGMRAAAPALATIAEERGLDLKLVINLDAISDQGDGAKGRVAAFGSIGKQLLTAFVLGREAHACYPRDGVNAAYLAAELVTEFELAEALAEHSGDEVAAPPTALHAKDLKWGYNVTTPGQAWVYWNTLQHRRSAKEVLAIARELTTRAMTRAGKRLGCTIDVLTYAEVAQRASINEEARKSAKQEDLDLPERSKRLTARACIEARIAAPAIVLGFGSIAYPAVTLEDARVEDAVRRAIAPFGLGAIRYFPGISDMSFLGRSGGAGDDANTPLAGTAFVPPQAAGLPCINIGPWGRDYHHWLERVEARYAFETLPHALLAVIDAMDD